MTPKDFNKAFKYAVRMTPKQKAKELTNKYLKSGMMIKQAKACALICVDEIENELGKPIMINVLDMYDLEYWQEVKKEIEKL